MKIVKQAALIFAVSLAGELISRALPFPLPGSIIGMLFSLALLFAMRRSINFLKETGNFLLDNMQLFFIPPAASLMVSFAVVGDKMLAVVLICIITTIITFAATAYTVRLVMALQRRAKGDSE